MWLIGPIEENNIKANNIIKNINEDFYNYLIDYSLLKVQLLFRKIFISKSFLDPFTSK